MSVCIRSGVQNGDVPALLRAAAPAQSAEPLLASSLVDADYPQALFDGLIVSTDTALLSPGAECLRTGVAGLDEALSSVLQSGKVIACSSETSTQRDELAGMLVADCLARCVEGQVAVIDTMGNFDVVGLYGRILKRLGEGESERAAAVLDRVKIMRVFDLVGVREAVGELRDELEGKVVEGERRGKVTASVEQGREKDEVLLLRKRTEVADSEDEDEDLEASDDEMLFDAEPPPPGPDQAPGPALQTEQHDTAEHQSHPKLKLILIDNLSHVLTPLLRRDNASGNTLAIAFLTTLAHLTRTHNLHTILLNPCTTPRTPQPQSTAAPPQNPVPLSPPSPSIFSSNSTVPALMGLLGRYADTHLLLSRIPRRKMDAKVFYADTGVEERGKRRGVETVGVLEVTADRLGDRVGAWGTFEEGKGVR